MRSGGPDRWVRLGGRPYRSDGSPRRIGTADPRNGVPMSVFKRLSLVFQQKANAALDKAENPAEALDLSYQKMVEQLQQVRRSIADVLTAQKRLEAQKATLQAQYDKLQGQARQALSQGQEQLARTALERAQIVSAQAEGLGPQIENLRNQESQLELTGQKLAAKVEAFRMQRDTMKAQYTAARASTQAIEGISGLSEEMADVSMMVERAQDKVNSLQARAQAVGELADSGVLEEGTLVVRIAGNDQYRLPVSIRPALDGLDAALVRAIDSNDAEGFAQCTAELIKLIHSTGQKLERDDLRSSDLIVPSADMTVEDAKRLMAEGGGTTGPGGAGQGPGASGTGPSPEGSATGAGQPGAG